MMMMMMMKRERGGREMKRNPSDTRNKALLNTIITLSLKPNKEKVIIDL
jgi:hypothetical protein